VKTMVRAPKTGVPLLCCWDECERAGFDEIRTVQGRGTPEELVYIFCSELHRGYWVNAHDYGNTPRGPLGLYLPR
jgi:hypothetical protein